MLENLPHQKTLRIALWLIIAFELVYLLQHILTPLPQTKVQIKQIKLLAEPVETTLDDVEIIAEPEPSPPEEVSTDSISMKITESHHNKNEQAEEQYQNALNTIDTNPNDTELKLNDIIKKYPDFNPARETLATLLIHKNRIVDAENIISDGLKSNPDYWPLIKLKAAILAYKNNNIDGAIKLLQDNPPESIDSNPEYYAFLAGLHLKNKSYSTATKIYYQLVHLPNANGTWWLGLATSLERSGNTNAAKQAYNEAYNSGDLSPSVMSAIQSKI